VQLVLSRDGPSGDPVRRTWSRLPGVRYNQTPRWTCRTRPFQFPTDADNNPPKLAGPVRDLTELRGRPPRAGALTTGRRRKRVSLPPHVITECATPKPSGPKVHPRSSGVQPLSANAAASMQADMLRRGHPAARSPRPDPRVSLGRRQDRDRPSWGPGAAQTVVPTALRRPARPGAVPGPSPSSCSTSPDQSRGHVVRGGGPDRQGRLQKTCLAETRGHRPATPSLPASRLTGFVHRTDRSTAAETEPDSPRRPASGNSAGGSPLGRSATSRVSG